MCFNFNLLFQATRIPDKLHRYVAPEILQAVTGEGVGAPRESSDVYSICGTMFHLLVGEEPFAEIIDSKIKHNKGELLKKDGFLLIFVRICYVSASYAICYGIEFPTTSLTPVRSI